MKKGLTGSNLKWIAIFSMLVDHVTYLFLGNYLVRNELVETDHVKYLCYQFLRSSIGRVAFPIFCFLLVEGFIWTSNKWKYGVRLFLFALISELPYDLFSYGKWNPMESKTVLTHSNVFFTLFYAFLAMEIVQWIADQKQNARSHPVFQNLWSALFLKASVIAAFAFLAEKMHSDYGAKGVIAVMLFYLFRYYKKEQILAGIVAFCWEPGALLAMIPLYFYNGERGRGNKYFFYFFYPVHLFLLYGLYHLLYT